MADKDSKMDPLGTDRREYIRRALMALIASQSDVDRDAPPESLDIKDLFERAMTNKRETEMRYRPLESFDLDLDLIFASPGAKKANITEQTIRDIFMGLDRPKEEAVATITR